MDDLPTQVADLLRARAGGFRRSKALQAPRNEIVELCRRSLDPRFSVEDIARRLRRKKTISLGSVQRITAAIRREARTLIIARTEG